MVAGKACVWRTRRLGAVPSRAPPDDIALPLHRRLNEFDFTRIRCQETQIIQLRWSLVDKDSPLSDMGMFRYSAHTWRVSAIMPSPADLRGLAAYRIEPHCHNYQSTGTEDCYSHRNWLSLHRLCGSGAPVWPPARDDNSHRPPLDVAVVSMVRPRGTRSIIDVVVVARACLRYERHQRVERYAANLATRRSSIPSRIHW